MAEKQKHITDERFRELVSEAGLKLTDESIRAFKMYYKMIVDKNKVMNLTAITEYDDVLIKHFVDSLLVKRAVENLQEVEPKIEPLTSAKVADIGTGAGFPGVPIKICCPDTEVTLMDSLNKRIRFLDEVIGELGLSGIVAVHGRCEDLGRDSGFRESFDYVLSRAVARLSVLGEYALPLVRPGGYFIAYKAEEIDDEAKEAKKAISVLGGELVDIIKVPLPGSDMIRSFCIIKKVKKCPNAYPRKAGTPAKQPL